MIVQLESGTWINTEHVVVIRPIYAKCINEHYNGRMTSDAEHIWNFSINKLKEIGFSTEIVADEIRDWDHAVKYGLVKDTGNYKQFIYPTGVCVYREIVPTKEVLCRKKVVDGVEVKDDMYFLPKDRYNLIVAYNIELAVPSGGINYGHMSVYITDKDGAELIAIMKMR
jgi:hypothetical protein